MLFIFFGFSFPPFLSDVLCFFLNIECDSDNGSGMIVRQKLPIKWQMQSFVTEWKSSRKNIFSLCVSMYNTHKYKYVKSKYCWVAEKREILYTYAEEKQKETDENKLEKTTWSYACVLFIYFSLFSFIFLFFHLFFGFL